MSIEKKDGTKTDDGELTAPASLKMLTADEIFAADDIEVAVIEVPEWGGSVALRSMSGEEAVLFVKAIQDDKTGKTSQGLKIVLMCAVDAEGKALFTEHQIIRLQKKSLKALMRLQNKAMEMNGLTPEETKGTKND